LDAKITPDDATRPVKNDSFAGQKPPKRQPDSSHQEQPVDQAGAEGKPETSAGQKPPVEKHPPAEQNDSENPSFAELMASLEGIPRPEFPNSDEKHPQPLYRSNSTRGANGTPVETGYSQTAGTSDQDFVSDPSVQRRTPGGSNLFGRLGGMFGGKGSDQKPNNASKKGNTAEAQKPKDEKHSVDIPKNSNDTGTPAGQNPSKENASSGQIASTKDQPASGQGETSNSGGKSRKELAASIWDKLDKMSGVSSSEEIPPKEPDAYKRWREARFAAIMKKYSSQSTESDGSNKPNSGSPEILESEDQEDELF